MITDEFLLLQEYDTFTGLRTVWQSV